MKRGAAVSRLLALHGAIDSEVERMESELDHTALEVLRAICANLSLAAAGVGHRSAARSAASRAWLCEYAQALEAVLGVWEMNEVEIVDAGPPLCLVAAPRFRRYPDGC